MLTIKTIRHTPHIFLASRKYKSLLLRTNLKIKHLYKKIQEVTFKINSLPALIEEEERIILLIYNKNNSIKKMSLESVSHKYDNLLKKQYLHLINEDKMLVLSAQNRLHIIETRLALLGSIEELKKEKAYLKKRYRLSKKGLLKATRIYKKALHNYR